MKAGLAMSGLVVVLMLAFAGAAGARHEPGQLHAQATKRFWHPAPTLRPTARLRPALSLRGHLHTFTLARAGLQRALVSTSTAVVALPRPDGTFQRFALTPSAIMAPGLARRHPGIHTVGRPRDRRPQREHPRDLSRIGFHASIRSAHGGWYIDPYYRNSQRRYVTYFRRQVADPQGPRGARPARSRPGALHPAATGDQLRTYRLALLTGSRLRDLLRRRGQRDRGEDRAHQPREPGLRGRDLDPTPADPEQRPAQPEHRRPDDRRQRPLRRLACFTTTQATNCTGSTLTRNRQVIGLLVGASAFDIGHIALGQPGGGIASLAVVGGNSKAQGCTGLTTPTGDFFAVDYVAHEMGHQFAGNHTFNGTSSNCGGGNRNGSTSVEPGSGSSVMAYAGICGSDNLQPHPTRTGRSAASTRSRPTSPRRRRTSPRFRWAR